MRDEDEARPAALLGDVRDISRMSVGELEDYVARLEAEIARARAAIAERRSVRDAAEALFRKKS